MEISSWSIKEDNTLARKTLAMLLIDSKALTQKETAALTNIEPQAVSKYFHVFKTEGAAGLVHNRGGQKKGDRYTPEVKGELIHVILKNPWKR